jgi:hypothetical protein
MAQSGFELLTKHSLIMASAVIPATAAAFDTATARSAGTSILNLVDFALLMLPSRATKPSCQVEMALMSGNACRAPSGVVLPTCSFSAWGVTRKFFGLLLACNQVLLVLVGRHWPCW